MDNISRASKLLNDDNKDFFPVPQIFPKGTLGMYPSKTLHDDENGALTPSVWLSVVGDEQTKLSFYGINFQLNLTVTTHQFCWFMGWIPHKSTRKVDNNNAPSLRICHLSYSKPEYEQLALSVLDSKHYSMAMKTIQFRKPNK